MPDQIPSFEDFKKSQPQVPSFEDFKAQQNAAPPVDPGDQPATLRGTAKAMLDSGIEGAKGIAKTVGRDAYGLLTSPIAGPIGMGLGYLGNKTGITPKVEAATETNPNSPAQTVGKYLTRGAELFAPGPKALEMLPSAERAGEGFQEVMQAARHVPVDTSKFAAPALAARKLNAVAGDPLPPVLRKSFLAVQPTTNPLTYEDARLLAGSAGRKAVNMTMQPMRATGPMQMHAAQLAKGLDEANGAAAESVGMGDKYQAAMKEYRQAKQLESAGNIAKKVATGAALTGGAYEGGKYAVRRLLQP